MTDSFAMSVEYLYAIRGLGTVFSGELSAGEVAVGDAIVCRTASKETRLRVLSIRDKSNKTLRNVGPGVFVAVVCNTISLKPFAANYLRQPGRDETCVQGITLAPAPKKKGWWPF